MSTSSTISSTTTNNIDIAHGHLQTPPPSTISTSTSMAISDLDCSSLLMNDNVLSNDLLMNVNNNGNAIGSNLSQESTNIGSKKIIKSETILDLEDLIGLTFDGQFYYQIQDNQLPELVSLNNIVSSASTINPNEKPNSMKNMDSLNESSSTNSASSSPLNTNHSLAKITSTITNNSSSNSSTISSNSSNSSSSPCSRSLNVLDTKSNLLNTNGNQLLMEQQAATDRKSTLNDGSINCSNLFTGNNELIDNIEPNKQLNHFLWDPTHSGINSNQFSSINLDQITGTSTDTDHFKSSIFMQSTDQLLQDSLQVLILF